MRYDPFRHHRRSIRLPGYDYAAGGSLFITICTRNHECLFGDVVDGAMRLTGYGEIVREEWQRSAEVRPTMVLDAFVIMPNHLHGIVTLMDDPNVGATCGRPDPNGGRPAGGGRPDDHADRAPPTARATAGRPYGPPPGSIGAFVGGFKSSATRRINALRDTAGTPVWQRNYYEHVVRDEEDFYRIQAYIEDNPRRWAEDEYHPNA